MHLLCLLILLLAAEAMGSVHSDDSFSLFELSDDNNQDGDEFEIVDLPTTFDDEFEIVDRPSTPSIEDDKTRLLRTLQNLDLDISAHIDPSIEDDTNKCESVPDAKILTQTEDTIPKIDYIENITVMGGKVTTEVLHETFDAIIQIVWNNILVSHNISEFNSLGVSSGESPYLTEMFITKFYRGHSTGDVKHRGYKCCYQFSRPLIDSFGVEYGLHKIYHPQIGTIQNNSATLRYGAFLSPTLNWLNIMTLGAFSKQGSGHFIGAQTHLIYRVNISNLSNIIPRVGIVYNNSNIKLLGVQYDKIAEYRYSGIKSLVGASLTHLFPKKYFTLASEVNVQMSHNIYPKTKQLILMQKFENMNYAHNKPQYQIGGLIKILLLNDNAIAIGYDNLYHKKYHSHTMFLQLEAFF